MNSYIPSVIKQLLYHKMLAEKSLEQLPPGKFSWQFNQESNSIAIIMRHMAGNMLSRFTDFLTSDGEKAWRNRDAEFEQPDWSSEELLAYWHKGWQCLLDAIAAIGTDDLGKRVYIRNEEHTVTEAINRQLAHYAYHVGQIVYIAKMLSDSKWKSLSIPRNQSAQFNELKFQAR